ncbi:hypothetical protein ABE088_15325 [Priestia megaterium]
MSKKVIFIEKIFEDRISTPEGYTRLGFRIRDEKGGAISLAGATVQVKIAGSKGDILDKQITILDEYIFQFDFDSQSIKDREGIQIEFVITHLEGEFKNEINIKTNLQMQRVNNLINLTFQPSEVADTQLNDEKLYASTGVCLNMEKNLCFDELLGQAGVDPEIFGAKYDGSDETDALFKTIEYCRNAIPGKVLPIKIPIHKTLVYSKPIVVYSGMHLYSGLRNSEFERQGVLQNTTTDMFSLQSDVSDICLYGICFKGNAKLVTTNVFTPQNHGNGFIIKYSLIQNCGFKYFNNIIDGRILGMHFVRNFINNGRYALSLAGGDNLIDANMISNNPFLLSSSRALVYLNYFGTSIFNNNYITGSINQGIGGIPLHINGDCRGTTLTKNCLDFSDYCACYMTSVKGIIFDKTFTRQNARVKYEQFNAIFILFDSQNIIFKNTQFVNQIPGTYTFAFRKTTKITSNIIIRDSIYDGDYQPLYYKPTDQSEKVIIDDPLATNYTGYEISEDFFLIKWMDLILENQFSQFNDLEHAQYGIDALKTVFIRGYITGGEVGKVICKLPRGYRPAISQKFVAVIGESSSPVAIITVNPNGDMILSEGPISSTWTYVALSISFKGSE